MTLISEIGMSPINRTHADSIISDFKCSNLKKAKSTEEVTRSSGEIMVEYC